MEGDVAELGLFCMDTDLTSADLDVERTLKEFSAKLEMLYDTRAQDTEHAAKVRMQCAEDIHSLAKALGGSKFQAKIDELVSQIDEAEGKGKWVKGKWVKPTGKKPLSMYDAELWQKAFPNLFPSGNGVFG